MPAFKIKIQIIVWELKCYCENLKIYVKFRIQFLECRPTTDFILCVPQPFPNLPYRGCLPSFFYLYWGWKKNAVLRVDGLVLASDYFCQPLVSDSKGCWGSEIWNVHPCLLCSFPGFMNSDEILSQASFFKSVGSHDF